MNRIFFAWNFIIGKNLIIYKKLTNEIIGILGNDEEIIKKGYDYKFVDENDTFVGKNNKIYLGE